MRRDIAQKIWTYTVAIIMIGLAALYSASHENVRVPHSIFYDQLLCTAVGLVFMYLLGKVDYRKFYDVAYVLFLLNIVLLVCVLASGKYILGARRWMMIGGISFQPSELTKLSLILVLGRYLSNRRPTLSFGFFSRSQILLKDLIVPFLITAVPMVMIFKQPDLGTAILLFGIFIVMVFVTNLEYRYIFGFLGLCLAALPFAWSILKPYQKDRLLVFLNPNIDPLGAGYTIIQSRIAVGSGQILGKGWLAGTQNQLSFLPERHTDFIFSVIGEEWGILGTLLLVCLYFLLIINSLQIANQVKDKFGMLVTVGIVGILTLQVVINVGMVLGLFPIVGLTLPFVSYGRTSFMVFILMMGFLLNLSKRRTIF
ncbi:MAG: rod shape-determining protein RodA [Omnitrophica WOR_2 bacterium RIFCSPHIGHO2_02_FULL_52_10]|nr:MAG: rod shape-determining protein RodA [Omnitrophica WOR_2 bacterium RIFCSPHIGHO2_02_FULL_52_10]